MLYWAFLASCTENVILYTAIKEATELWLCYFKTGDKHFMRQSYKKTIIVLLALFLLLLLSYAGVNNKFYSNKTQAKISKGVLNLTEWNFQEDGPVKLDGEWEFYWEELIYPGDFLTHEIPKPAYINVPDTWNGYNTGSEVLNGQGYATYRLKIIVDEANQEYAIKIPYVFSAYNIWINGQLLSSNSVVGESKESMNSGNLPKVVSFKARGNKAEIVMQVSNFMHDKGGIPEKLILADSKRIMEWNERQILGEIFLMGILFIMGLYYFIFYLFRRKEKAIFYFALLCLLVCIRVGINGENILGQIFPSLSWEMGLKVDYLTYYCAVPIFTSFIKCLYPEEMSSKIYKFVYVISSLFIMLIILTPGIIYTRFNILYQLYTVLVSLYLLSVLIRAIRMKREDAILFCSGGLILLLIVINDILSYNGVFLTQRLFPIGVLIFIFLTSTILALRLSAAFKQSQELAQENVKMLEELRKINRKLEDMVIERTAKLDKTIERLNIEVKEHKKVAEKLKIYATTDLMTGALNRVTGMSFLEKQIKLSKRNYWYLTICFLDIDGLKQLNDSWGHQTGDELIIESSKIIKKNIREADTYCRLGGDEFLIIFSQCTRVQAEQVWERISEDIDRFNRQQNKRFTISISHGFAEYGPGAVMEITDMIEEADVNMYQQKASAR